MAQDVPLYVSTATALKLFSLSTLTPNDETRIASSADTILPLRIIPRSASPHCRESCAGYIRACGRQTARLPRRPSLPAETPEERRALWKDVQRIWRKRSNDATDVITKMRDEWEREPPEFKRQ